MRNESHLVGDFIHIIFVRRTDECSEMTNSTHALASTSTWMFGDEIRAGQLRLPAPTKVSEPGAQK